MSATSDDTRPVDWVAPLLAGAGLVLVAIALGNSLVPLGTGELAAAVVLGAVLRRRPLCVGLLLAVAPGAVLMAHPADRSAGRALGPLVRVAAAALFLGCAAGGAAAWADGRRGRWDEAS